MGTIIYENMTKGNLKKCTLNRQATKQAANTPTVILPIQLDTGTTLALPITSTPDNRIIKLRDGRGMITCRYDMEYQTAKSAYRAPLVLELWYGYSETQRRNVHIKRVS